MSLVPYTNETKSVFHWLCNNSCSPAVHDVQQLQSSINHCTEQREHNSNHLLIWGTFNIIEVWALLFFFRCLSEVCVTYKLSEENVKHKSVWLSNFPKKMWSSMVIQRVKFKFCSLKLYMAGFTVSSAGDSQNCLHVAVVQFVVIVFTFCAFQKWDKKHNINCFHWMLTL